MEVERHLARLFSLDRRQLYYRSLPNQVSLN